MPVYEGYRGNVVSLLYAKDLAFVDPDDKMPLRTICEFYSNPCHFVFENVTLNVLFNVFKQGIYLGLAVESCKMFWRNTSD